VRTLLGCPSADGRSFRATGDQFAQLMTIAAVRPSPADLKTPGSPAHCAFAGFSQRRRPMRFTMLSGSEEKIYVLAKRCRRRIRCSTRQTAGTPDLSRPRALDLENAITRGF